MKSRKPSRKKQPPAETETRALPERLTPFHKVVAALIENCGLEPVEGGVGRVVLKHTVH